jgi:Flp pilus assembly protein TadG
MKDESGQVLVITAVVASMLIVCVGLVVDVGHAMLVQRQLQAGVDAAALAGVQHLPDKAQAEAVAVQYSATPGSKNAVNTVDNATTTAEAKCLQGVPGCNRRDGGVNGIVVRSSSNVPTWFGRIIGITKMTVSATATACSPCSVKPLDVMVVLDRTGSMCQIQGRSDPACTDLNRAKNGIRTFLTFMDPTIDKVGLALTPPTINAQMISRCPYTPWNGNSNPQPPPSSMSGRYYGYDQWWHPDGIDAPNGQDSSHYVVASLEGADGFPGDDYLVQDQVTGEWNLNSQSPVVQRLGCTRGAGSTSYALAIEDAQWELTRNGRGGVQDVIIFLSDGAANTSPTNVPTGHWTSNGGPSVPNSWFNRPCGSGVESASRVKGQNNTGTIVYTIGYDLGTSGGTTERCQRPDSFGHQDNSSPVPESCGSWGCNAADALRAMASPSDPTNPSSPPNYYFTPDGSTLNQIFTQIAMDLSGSRGRLIDNSAPNLIS